MPAPTFVNATTFSDATGTNNPTVPLPSGVANGDRLIAVLVNAGTDDITAPSGWTQLINEHMQENGEICVVQRIMVSGVTGATFAVAGVAGSKQVGAMVAYRGEDAIVAGTAVNKTTSTNTIVAPGVTTTENNERVIGFFADRVSSQTSVTAPSGTAQRASQIQGGGGGCSVLVCDEDFTTAGATGTRTATYGVASPNGVGVLLRLSPTASTPPTVDAGVDATSQISVAFSRTATASDPDSSITSRQWTQISGPDSPAISGATTATMSVTPTVTGTYVFRHTATSADAGSGFDEYTLTVVSASARPDGLITNPGNYANVGGAASHQAALADESDATWIESPDAAVGAAVTLSMSPLQSGDVTVKVKARSSTTPVVTMRTSLYEGSTLIAQWDDVTTTAFAEYIHTTTSAQTANIQSFTDLRVELKFQA